MDNMQEQFNIIADEYDRNRRRFIPCFDEFYKGSAAFIAEDITYPEKILDLGAGTGLLSHFLYEHFPKADFVLADIAEEMLKIAEKRFAGCKNVSCVTADYSQGLPRGEFDLIVSALSVHHLENRQKAALFSRIYERLPQNGSFINFDQFCADDAETEKSYNSCWEKHLYASGLTEHDIDLWRNRRKLDRECSVISEIKMLNECGFKRVSCIYSCRKFAVISAKKQIG
ncbi:MAG: class I SAM-dependent methyltransferase [Ruminococcus sp.]|nr:class I SAM-dependent methyltransferase [Ruminococcus sp.]